MNYTPRLIIPAFLLTLAGSVALSTLVPSVPAQGTETPTLISLQFRPPGDPVPATSVGGGTRGNVRFAPPGDPAPVTSVGGGTRGNVRFAPPGEAAPVTSVGGGSRGQDGTLDPRDPGIEAMALLPSTQHGRTMSPRPTFFVYLPPTATQQIFFSIQDQDGNHHYQTTLEIPQSGGIVSFTLPETAPELELDTNYLWFFVPLDASGRLQPDSSGVTGWVKRVEEMALTPDLEAVALATAYGEAGVWYDTLTTLALAQRNQPENLTLAKAWQDLLVQVGLEEIALSPLLGEPSP